MEYIDSDGEKKNPYIIHRTSIGCYERTLALLIEKYAGALPTWMSPEQVRILTITDRANDYAEEIRASLTAKKYRVSVDDSQNTLKYKIRNAQLEKVPYMIILGDKDIENKTVSVRHRSGEDLGAIPMEQFEAILADIVDNKLKK